VPSHLDEDVENHQGGRARDRQGLEIDADREIVGVHNQLHDPSGHVHPERRGPISDRPHWNESLWGFGTKAVLQTSNDGTEPFRNGLGTVRGASFGVLSEQRMPPGGQLARIVHPVEAVERRQVNHLRAFRDIFIECDLEPSRRRVQVSGDAPDGEPIQSTRVAPTVGHGVVVHDSRRELARLEERLEPLMVHSSILPVPARRHQGRRREPVRVREAKPSARSRFNLPAGKPEVGETLVEAAVREANEETRLDVVVDHLVGIYQCPRTSEGFGVVNFVFASHVVGGTITTTPAHPEVCYFTNDEIASLSRDRKLRGSHIELAIEAFENGERLPLDVVRVLPASPLPSTAR